MKIFTRQPTASRILLVIICHARKILRFLWLRSSSFVTPDRKLQLHEAVPSTTMLAGHADSAVSVALRNLGRVAATMIKAVTDNTQTVN
jgi:hypothetical protein